MRSGVEGEVIHGIRIPEGFYVGVEIYAKDHGISVATVKRRCAAGDLRAIKIGNSWFIPMPQRVGDYTMSQS